MEPPQTQDEMPWQCADCGAEAAGTPTPCCGAGVFDPQEKPEPGHLRRPWLSLPKGATPEDMKEVDA